jgi:hypothetical protein
MVGQDGTVIGPAAGGAYARLNWQIELIHHKTTFGNQGVHG